jgi:hypothetical protein
MEFEVIILGEVAQSQKSMYMLTYKWLLVIKYRITMLYSTDPVKLKKEDPSEDA